MLGPWDELAAQRFVGGVEGDGEIQGEVFLGELFIFKGTPTVETVILRAPMLRHLGSCKIWMAFITFA